MGGWLFILLCAACSVLIAHFFKVVEFRKLNTVRVLTINYLIATITAVLMSGYQQPFSEISISAGDIYGPFLLAIFTGTLFITNFFIYSKSVHYNGVGISVAAMRISLIIPVLLSILWYLEMLSPLQWAGVFMVFITLFLLLPNKNDLLKEPFSAAWLLVLIFVFTGVGDASLKVYEEEFSGLLLKQQFMAMVFFTALFIGAAVLTVQKKWKLKKQELLLGAAIGIPNLLTAIFLIEALERMNGAIVYSAVNVLTVAGATILGIVRWSDRFTRLQWTGIILAVIAILVLI
jgi:drug/metabolite transporter (DMT)-like permease